MSGAELTIVGAGLVGSMLAIVLREKGYEVVVYERYQDIRAIPSVGRSINLVATARGLRALSALPPSVKADLLELGTKVTGRIIHMDGAEPVFQRYGKDDSEFNLSISRYELNVYLMNRAEESGAKIHFGHALQTADFFSLGPTEKVLRFAVDGGKALSLIHI